MTKYPTEQVFIVPRSDGNFPDRFSFRPTEDLMKFQKGNGRFIMRHDAEMNCDFYQLIPYIIVLNRTGDKVYVARRIGGDKRLEDKWSFFGGHINPEDFNDKASVIENAAYRELGEELNYTPVSKNEALSFRGTIMDRQSATSEHIGFVYSIKAHSVSVRETDNLKGAWMSFDEMVENYSAFESWAKYIIDYIFVQNKGIGVLTGGVQEK